LPEATPLADPLPPEPALRELASGSRLTAVCAQGYQLALSDG
jgi:hypothetical protein